jgi:hypothetical protein
VRGTTWRLYAIWLPASIAGASLTPRDLTHYALEAMPALSIGVTALAFHIARRLDLRGPAGLLAGVGAFLALLVAAEGVLILPAEETALLTRGRPATIYGHAIHYSALPAYYASWLDGRLEDSPATFPGPMGEEVAEARLIAGMHSLPPGPLLVLGDRSWIYFLSGRLPASRYVALNSAFRLVPGGSDELRAAIASRRPRLVVLADAPQGDWRSLLLAGGYREIGASPYPLFVLAGG